MWIIFILLKISLIIYIKSIEWTIWTTIAAYAYFIILFIVMQILYQRGAKLNKVKLQQQNIASPPRSNKKLKRVS